MGIALRPIWREATEVLMVRITLDPPPISMTTTNARGSPPVSFSNVSFVKFHRR